MRCPSLPLLLVKCNNNVSTMPGKCYINADKFFGFSPSPSQNSVSSYSRTSIYKIAGTARNTGIADTHTIVVEKAFYCPVSALDGATRESNHVDTQGICDRIRAMGHPTP